MIGKLVILWLGSSLLLSAAAEPTHRLDEGVEQFRKAYQSWDDDGFRAAALQFKKSAKGHPQCALCHYWLGVTRFHRMLILQGRYTLPQQNDDVATQTHMAIDALEVVVAADPTHAEAHAILATIHGMRIQSSFLGALRFGPKVHKHHQLALKHGAKNPRVQYLLGASLFHTADDEADRLEALKTLLLAEALFDAEQKKQRPDTAPRWGRDACLAFIGHSFARLHQPAKAEDYYQKALKVCPSNRMAKSGLESLKTH